MQEFLKFECGHCAQQIEASYEMLGQKVLCSNCGTENTVWKKFSAEELALVRHYNKVGKIEKIDAALEDVGKPRPGNNQVHKTASTFSGIAVFMAAVGIVVVICGAASDPASIAAIYTGSAMCGLAMWCFLLAQIMYIRAALEK